MILKQTKKSIFGNVKGGVGKSLLILNLLGCLSEKGYKVLGVDCDPQSNLTKSLTGKKQSIGLYELLLNECKVEDILLQPYNSIDSLKNIFLIPSTYNLFLYERNHNLKNQIFDLKNKLSTIIDFDYILIDSNPSISFILNSAFTYADYYISVFDMSSEALDGFKFLESTIISNIKKTTNKNLGFKGIILNNKKGSTIFNSQFIDAVQKQYGDKVFKTIISDLVVNKEARASNLPTINYSPKHQASLQFMELTENFIKMMED